MHAIQVLREILSNTSIRVKTQSKLQAFLNSNYSSKGQVNVLSVNVLFLLLLTN